MEIPPIPIERAPRAMTLPSEQGLFLAKGSEALNPTIHTKRVDGWAVAPLGLFGFAFSCFVTGLTYMDIVPYGTLSISVYLLYGGLCQYIFGVIDWYRGNSLNSCLSILFALYNSCFLFFDMLNEKGLGWGPAENGKSKGFFNLLWVVYMVGASIAVFPTAKMSFVNDIFVIISFASQSAYFYTDGEEVVFARMAGVASFCITAITTYITISIILAEVYKVSYLPIFYPGEKTYWNSRKEKKNV